MTQKRIREFEKLLKADGLQFSKPKAEGLRIWTEIRAENGATRRFSIATEPGDVRSELNERSKWRRWTRENGTMDLPGIEVIGIEVLNLKKKLPARGAVEYAARVAVDGNDPRLHQAVADKLEHYGAPITIQGQVMGAFTGTPEVDETPPPSVETTEQEINDALSEAEAVSQPQFPFTKPKEKSMPRTKLALAPTPDAPKRKRTIDLRIGQVEFFRLCSILKELDMAGISTQPKLQAKLIELFGHDLALSTVGDALRATGKQLDKPKVGLTTIEAQQVIARSLIVLLTKLSEPIPEDLAEVAGV